MNKRLFLLVFILILGCNDVDVSQKNKLEVASNERTLAENSEKIGVNQQELRFSLSKVIDSHFDKIYAEYANHPEVKDFLKKNKEPNSIKSQIELNDLIMKIIKEEIEVLSKELEI